MAAIEGRINNYTAQGCPIQTDSTSISRQHGIFDSPASHLSPFQTNSNSRSIPGTPVARSSELGISCQTSSRSFFTPNISSPAPLIGSQTLNPDSAMAGENQPISLGLSEEKCSGGTRTHVRDPFTAKVDPDQINLVYGATVSQPVTESATTMSNNSVGPGLLINAEPGRQLKRSIILCSASSVRAGLNAARTAPVTGRGNGLTRIQCWQWFNSWFSEANRTT